MEIDILFHCFVFFFLSLTYLDISTYIGIDGNAKYIKLFCLDIYGIHTSFLDSTFIYIFCSVRFFLNFFWSTFFKVFEFFQHFLILYRFIFMV